MAQFKAPFVKAEGGVLLILTIIGLYFAAIVGWFMNLQNLWEY